MKSKKVQNRRRDIFEVFEKEPLVHRDVYINDPGCINMTEDGVGNCIGGWCRPSMAAGSCGCSAFTSLCASRGKTHGGGFDYVDYRGGGGVGDGVGCGGS